MCLSYHQSRPHCLHSYSFIVSLSLNLELCVILQPVPILSQQTARHRWISLGALLFFAAWKVLITYFLVYKGVEKQCTWPTFQLKREKKGCHLQLFLCLNHLEIPAKHTCYVLHIHAMYLSSALCWAPL